MRKILILSFLFLPLLCLHAIADSTLIDFELLGLGSLWPSYSEAGVTFSTTNGTLIKVYQTTTGGRGIVGNTQEPWAPIRADFDSCVDSATVLLGDSNIDNEEIHFEAYDASDNLIEETIVALNGAVWQEVIVAGSCIDHVIWKTINPDPSHNNSVIADSFEFTRTPKALPGIQALPGIPSLLLDE